jgi:hypothetical protein
MPEALTKHLEEMQRSAYLAEGLIDAISACGSSPKRIELIATLAEEAQKILKELGEGLDSVNLQKVQA